MRLEALLGSMGGEDTGVGQKARSLEDRLPPQLAMSLRRIAGRRNKLLHEISANIGDLAARVELGERAAPHPVIESTETPARADAGPGSEACVTGEMHGPGRDAEAPLAEHRPLRTHVEQLRGWLALVSQTIASARAGRPNSSSLSACCRSGFALSEHLQLMTTPRVPARGVVMWTGGKPENCPTYP